MGRLWQSGAESRGAAVCLSRRASRVTEVCGRFAKDGQGMESRDVQRGASGRGQSPGDASRALIVALMGLPGAGKSTVARVLERELGLRRVCRDAIRHAMFPRCEYSFVEKRAAFRTVLLAVEINCLLGESSVIDGMTFSRREDYDQVVALADAHGFDILPLLIDCPPVLARERIARDLVSGDLLGMGHVAEDREPELVDLVARRFDTPPAAAIRIDATRPMAEVCRAAVAEVSARIGRASARS
jgi:predicted kinase